MYNNFIRDVEDLCIEIVDFFKFKKNFSIKRFYEEDQGYITISLVENNYLLKLQLLITAYHPIRNKKFIEYVNVKLNFYINKCIKDNWAYGQSEKFNYSGQLGSQITLVSSYDELGEGIKVNINTDLEVVCAGYFNIKPKEKIISTSNTNNISRNSKDQIIEALQKISNQIPNSKLNPKISEFVNEFGLRDESPLRHLGYIVGKKGLTRFKRQQFLKGYLGVSLPTHIFPTDYLDEWGEPNSTKRLNRMINHLEANANRCENNDYNRYHKAICDWREDASFLKQIFEYDFDDEIPF